MAKLDYQKLAYESKHRRRTRVEYEKEKHQKTQDLEDKYFLNKREWGRLRRAVRQAEERNGWKAKFIDELLKKK